MYIYIYICIHVYTHIHIRIRIRIRIRIHIHTYMYMLVLSKFLVLSSQADRLALQSVFILYSLLTVHIILLFYIQLSLNSLYKLQFTPSPPTKSLDFRGFDSSKLLILRGGNSHVRIISQGTSRKVCLKDS